MRLCNVLGPAIAGAVIWLWEIRLVFLVQALVTLPAMLVVLATMPYMQPAKKKAAGCAECSTVLKDNSYSLATAGVYCFATVVARQTRGMIVPLQGHAIGLDASQVSWLTSISFCAELTLFWISGLLMDRCGRKSSAVPSTLGMGIALALVPHTRSFGQLLLAAGLFGLSSTLGSGIVQTLTIDFTPTANKNQFLAIFRAVRPWLVGMSHRRRSQSLGRSRARC